MMDDREGLEQSNGDWFGARDGAETGDSGTQERRERPYAIAIICRRLGKLVSVSEILCLRLGLPHSGQPCCWSQHGGGW
jgi:hypothetical protein